MMHFLSAVLMIKVSIYPWKILGKKSENLRKLPVLLQTIFSFKTIHNPAKNDALFFRWINDEGIYLPMKNVGKNMSTFKN